jgi:cell wall assembly regulator SMI1
MSMWVELVSEVQADARFEPPATTAAIDEVERRLGQTLPPDLRALLLETNGLRESWFGLAAVWPAERIGNDNIEFRTFPDFADLYQPFDGLMFFGDNGGGDQFAFHPDKPEAGVFVWEHETDERRKVADDLADYLRRRLVAEGGDDWYTATT